MSQSVDGVGAGLDQSAGGVDVIGRDRGLVWHPYAPLDGPAPYAVRAAQGTRLSVEAADGACFEAVDAMSSWWSAVHGYRNPVLDDAVREQVGRFSHVMFGGLTHAPAVELAEQLRELAPGMAHVFFADSGSVSMEVALKLAVQYQAAQGRPQRGGFVALRGGYHGDTLGAMSVCDPVDGMHAAFPALLPRHVLLPRPPVARLVDASVVDGGVGMPCSAAGRVLVSDEAQVEAWVAQLEQVVAEHADHVAALVAEPVLQGAGGMYVWAPEAMRRVADEHGLLLLLDEIATGFGRTGQLFASQWAGVRPDVMCVGKALTGGYMTLAAVLCSARVGEVITRSQFRALLHGPTFMANPLACAVAGASVGLVREGWGGQVAMLESELLRGLEAAWELPSVMDVRVLGGVGVVELCEEVDVPAVTRAALEAGVWVRPFRRLVYTMPPYVASAQEVAQVAAGIVSAVGAVYGVGSR